MTMKRKPSLEPMVEIRELIVKGEDESFKSLFDAYKLEEKGILGTGKK